MKDSPDRNSSSSSITRREFLKKGSGIAVSASVLPTLSPADPGTESMKNIVVIMSDQHRWDMTGFSGNPDVETPNIDGLAEEGVRFDSMYSQFPLCVPSRQSIVTSQYAATHGTRLNVVPPAKPTLLDHVHGSHGYSTFISGKSHMTTRAFDVCVDEDSLNSYLPVSLEQAVSKADSWYSDQYAGMEAWNTRSKINSRYLLYPMAEEWHQENLFYRVAKNILEAHPERPILLWVSFIKPHTNWTPPERFLEKYRSRQLPTPEPESSGFIDTLPMFLQDWYYQNEFHILTQDDLTNSVRAYYACVEYMDHVVGLVLSLLDRHGLAEDTVMVYTADHGEMLGHNGLFFKQCFYEPAVRVPCVMRYPGVIPAGRVVGQITELIDILPTLLDYAGIPPAGTEEGLSMRGLIENPVDSSWKNEAFAEFALNYVMARKGKWKYNRHPGDLNQLFDLESDPGERINLYNSATCAGVVNYLEERIRRRFGRIPGLI